MAKKSSIPNISPSTAAIFGGALSAVYFSYVESSVPKTSNCTYLAPWSTDLLAGIAGAVLIHLGYKYDDGLLSLIGSIVAGIHLAQYAAHKTLVHRGVATPFKS